MDANLQLEAIRQTAIQRQAGDTLNPVEKGVSISWLAAAFGMSEQQVRYRLRGCPIKQSAQRGTKMLTTLYDLKIAAKHLVTPAIPTREILRALKRGDLPPQLSDSFWAGLLKRQQWELNAGELWRTEKIRDVLAETFQTIKFQMNLWDATLERSVELTEQQRTMIVDLKDALSQEIYDALVKNMENVSTGSQLSELEDWFGESETVAQMVEEEEDDFI